MNKIKKTRKNQNLTLKDLSKLTNISISYISELETGSAKNPTKETMDKIAAALNSTVKEIFY